MELKPVSDQVVVVMGASSGIGRAAALALARRGATVVVSARREGALRSLVEEITAGGGTATAVVADVTDPAQVRAVADRAAAEHGRLDSWVHLAGVALFAAFEDTTPEEFARVVDVNLMGQVHGAAAALPHLRREGRGALVHVTSMGAKRGVPLQSAYIASKHAVDGFLEVLRMEVQRSGVPISVTQIMPATINTPLFDQARTKLGVKPVAPPPVYQPDVVVEAILHAVEHPTRDIVVGAAAKAMVVGEKVAPRLLDALLVRFGFEAHDTGQPKPADAPDNLFAPLDGFATAQDGFGDSALRRSLYTRARLSPLGRALPVAAVAGAAGLALRAARR
ncbi:SDR family oxidoreductase [Quadrisphaera sp. DSM 44207]|uniref:SDR family oxidoreductase n=1 Tax=Quadrisphaera sp. DSM 44207 TaxID=1881057 RepID=UPI00350EEF33